MRSYGSDNRRGAATAVALVLALLLAACAEEGDDTAADDVDAGVEESDGEQDVAAEEAVADEEAGEEFAEATWMGEELAFQRVECGMVYQLGQYEVRANIEGGGYLQARLRLEPDADHDDEPVLRSGYNTVQLYFDGDGDMFVDGELYVGGTETLDYSTTHAAGTLDLRADSSTQAEEVNPDGGTLDFEIRC